MTEAVATNEQKTFVSVYYLFWLYPFDFDRCVCCILFVVRLRLQSSLHTLSKHTWMHRRMRRTGSVWEMPTGGTNTRATYEWCTNQCMLHTVWKWETGASRHSWQERCSNLIPLTNLSYHISSLNFIFILPIIAGVLMRPKEMARPQTNTRV